MGFQNANENVLHGFGTLVIRLWTSFGNIFKGVCTNPGLTNLQSVGVAQWLWSSTVDMCA